MTKEQEWICYRDGADPKDSTYMAQTLYFLNAVRAYTTSLRSIGCESAARKLKKNFSLYSELHIMKELEGCWQEMLDMLLNNYCCSAIQAKIRKTPQQFRKMQWPKELLEHMIQICRLDNCSRYRLYIEAGWECPVPDELVQIPAGDKISK